MNDRWVAGSAFLAGMTLGVLGLYLLGYRPTTPTPAPVSQSSSRGFTGNSSHERTFPARLGEPSGLARDNLSLGNLSFPQLEQLAQLYQTVAREQDLSPPNLGASPATFVPTATLPPPTHAPSPPPEPSTINTPYVVPQQAPSTLAPFPPIPIPTQWRFIKR